MVNLDETYDECKWHYKVEDHYWETDGLTEELLELLERFIINISGSESSDNDVDEGVNDGFSDGDSTSFGSRSESTSSSDEVEIWKF